MTISVGSVEVDVIPNTRGVYARLQAGLVPSASRVGEEMGRVMGARLAAGIRDAVGDGIRQGGVAARASAVRQGGDAGGAFGRMFRTRVEAALRSLPDISIGANTSEADADIRALRVQLETLARQRVGIDVDAVTARRQIDELERELTRLGAQHPDVAVRMNTAAATAQLAALRAEIDAIDGRDVDVRVDPAVRSFGMLVTAAAAFGPAILPVLPIVAAGLGAVAAAGVAAAVGLGSVGLVAVPALKDIGGALQAQKAAQDAATASTSQGAGAAVAARQRALQMASAVQGLAAAERNGARQVAQARESAAQAAAQAAQQSQRAARQVQDAERALGDAQKDAKRAQEALTDARKAAADQLRDLNERLADSALDERAAVIRVREAQDELNKTKAAGAKATDLDRDRAQLAYDQAVQGLAEQRREGERLKKETAAANRAGVEGSDTVLDAQNRLADAKQQVADRSRALSDAEAEQARVQVQGARDVAKAQEAVATAQQNAAESVASAQRQIESAQLSAASSGNAAADAQAKYQAALAKLTPAARGTFNAFVNLRTAFSAWSRSLQPQVMPIFTRALEGMRNALPGLTPFVLAAARAIGTLQDKVSAGFKSPWWRDFKADLAGSIEPAIVGLGTAFGNLFKGMAGVIQAFLPHMDGISASMQRITGRFANWGSNLKGSPAFERFLSYSSEQAPLLADMLGNLLSAITHLGVALAPMAGTAQSFINALATGISAVPVDVLTVVGVAFASIAIGAKLAAASLAIWRGAVIAAGVVTALLTGETIALNAAQRANVIGLIVTAIMALVVAIIYAYQHSETFRAIVQGAWEGIKTTISFVWNSVLKPTFAAIVTAVQAIGTAASWLWRNILSPVFGFIATAAKVLLTAVVVVVLLPIIAAVKLLGAHFKWLYEKAIKPALDAAGAAAKWLWEKVLSPVFGWIGDKAKWLWEKAIKPAWASIKTQFEAIGTTAKWVWDQVLSPVFGWIGDAGTFLWDEALKPAFENIKDGIKAVGDSFEDAKDFIKLAWDKVKDIAKAPVRFVIDKIYNAGIVPTWNTIAKAFGAPKLDKIETEGWARGGVLPGRSTYRQGDDQLVPMRRGEGVYVSEAMRDPFERARLYAVNRAAMSGKSLAPYQGQGFSMGGIFDWVGSTASKGVDLAKSGVSWLKDGVKASAEAGLNEVVKPLLKKIAGSASAYRDMITGVPKKMVKTIVGYSDKADTKLSEAGIGGGGFKAGLKWARTQAGKDYQWGGNGNPSWDCSGFVSAIESVIRGQKPHRRWATGAFSGKTAPPGWVLNGKSPYMIGITNAGVGHTAGTLNGVNVESRGGDGVVVGKSARAWNNNLFTSHYAYKGTYDQGGYLQPGLNLAYNGTGRPEPVFTTQQANSLMGRASEPAGGFQAGQPVTLMVKDGPTLEAYVAGVADGRVDAGFTAVRRGMSHRG